MNIVLLVCGFIHWIGSIDVHETSVGDTVEFRGGILNLPMFIGACVRVGWVLHELFIERVRVFRQELCSDKHEDQHDDNLEDGLQHDVLEHLSRNDVFISVVRRTMQQDFLWCFCR